MADNQHYISRAYLDKFIHPSSKDRHLFPYVKDYGRKKPAGPRRLASADQFYVQHENGVTTNQLDESRQKVENLYFASGSNPSPFVKCAIDDAFTPIQSDKTMFAGAAAFLRCGSPVQIHNAAMLGLMAAQMDIFNELTSEEARKRFEEEHGIDADSKLQEARDTLWNGELFADVGEENWRQLGFMSFHMEETWLNALMQMGMTVCSCHSRSCFLRTGAAITVSVTAAARDGAIVPF